MDLLVEEIVGGGIGVVPGNATASNFAKSKKGASSEDLARGIANMIGQTIASLAVLPHEQKIIEILFLEENSFFSPRSLKPLPEPPTFMDKIIVPQYAEYLSAVGAGILASK